MTTLFERYGGFATVERIVSEFYRRILDDPALAAYFTGIDMPRLVNHQTRFVASVMGGPVAFTADQLAHAHSDLNITAEHFDTVAAILRGTLKDSDVEEADIAAICDEVMGLKPFIVGKA